MSGFCLLGILYFSWRSGPAHCRPSVHFFSEVSFPGNGKADERAGLAAEEPDARGVERLGYSGRVEARTMPLAGSLAHFK